MKILLIIPSITNYFTFLDELTESCIKQGVEVGLIASPKHFDSVTCYDEKPRCPYFPIALPQGMNPVAHIKASREIQKIVDKFNPDIIHAHIGAAIFSVSLSKKKNWPIVMATHHGLLGPLMAGFKGRIASLAEKFTFRRVNQSFLLNRSDQEWLEKRGVKKGIEVYKTYGIGCRSDQFNPDLIKEGTQDELREKLGIHKDDFVFIYVGRHVWFKGFDLVVRAFSKLQEANKNIKLILMGEPYAVHSTGLTEDEVASMNSNASIIPVGWKINVQEYLSIADVNLFPSEREGMPVNIMESVSMGVPVITRDTRGCHDIITSNENGFLLKERSVNELLGCMDNILKKPDLLNSLRGNCIRQRPNLDRKLWVSEQILYYKQALNKTA